MPRPESDGMLLRKFGVIKLWPKLKTAEDECISRIKSAAAAAGLECVEVDYSGRLTAPPYTQLTRNDVDFILSLHFETPKCYDIFSFVALWNPLQFYHDWGYRKFTQHLLTHDDFLSCSSPWSDDHVIRNITGDPTRDLPRLLLYHSLPGPLFEPALGDRMLFYVGINWERIAGQQGRHDELLKLLDRRGCIRIFGPKEFQGVEVWRGYRTYSGPLPFDGVSVVHEIHRAGIGLALSSKAHTESELMSNRLFECLAAGVVTICDENPFARRFFGDSLLYIDASLPAGEVCAQISAHLDWIRANPGKALQLAGAAQQIFREKFTLKQCLEDLYAALPCRKEQLRALCSPKQEHGPIDVFFLMPVYDPEVLERHLENCRAQRDVVLRPVLLMSSGDFPVYHERVRARFAESDVRIEVHSLDFFDFHPDGSLRSRIRLGKVMSDAIRSVLKNEWFCFVAPHERLFSGHFQMLLKALEGDPEADVAASGLLYRQRNTPNVVDLREELILEDCAPDLPLGHARFLVRRAAIREDVHTALRYLDTLAMHALVFPHKVARSRRATVMLDLQDEFNLCFCAARPAEEREILIDYCPERFRKNLNNDPVALFERLDPGAKTRMAVALAHSVPIPKVLNTLTFGIYRWWLKRRSR